MKHNDNNLTINLSIDQEDVLIALDQLSQTVEVMGQTINRLKRQLHQADKSQVEEKRPSQHPQVTTSPPKRKVRDSHAPAIDPTQPGSFKPGTQKEQRKQALLLH